MNRTIMKDLFAKIKDRHPLIHHITNNVTVNDCANVTLAIGASPVMATSLNEVADMVKLADALVINIGTITDSIFESILLAGQAANKKGIPVVFDPVGVGATPYRTEKAIRFLKEVDVSIVRGNASEVLALIGGDAETRGVDVGNVSVSNKELAIKASQMLEAIIVISGKYDCIAKGTETVQIENGDIWLTRITGTGCMTTSLVACFAGITDDLFSAAITGMSVMSLAGERAKKAIRENAGIGTYRMKLMDEIFLMDEQKWEEGVRLL